MGAGYTGTIAGITFEDGYPAADTEVPGDAVLAGLALYVKRNGHLSVVTDDDGEQRLVVVDRDEDQAPDPRSVHKARVGTPLRDAAVDPRPGDYLPPTNAGKANPHGPLVVSPEIHGSQGVRPILEGEVEAAPAQERAETADAVESTDVELTEPAKNGSKVDWVAYAVSKGAEQEAAEQLTRDALAELYGSED